MRVHGRFGSEDEGVDLILWVCLNESSRFIGSLKRRVVVVNQTEKQTGHIFVEKGRVSSRL